MCSAAFFRFACGCIDTILTRNKCDEAMKSNKLCVSEDGGQTVELVYHEDRCDKCEKISKAEGSKDYVKSLQAKSSEETIAG
jgi:hypothetical protein